MTWNRSNSKLWKTNKAVSSKSSRMNSVAAKCTFHSRNVNNNASRQYSFEVRHQWQRARISKPSGYDATAVVTVARRRVAGQLAQSLLTQTHPLLLLHWPSLRSGGRRRRRFRASLMLITWRSGGGAGALVRRPAIGALSGAH